MTSEATFDFSNSKVLVVGASRAGIGAAIARAFQDSGADVTLTGVEPEAAEEDRNRFSYVRLDVTQADEIAALAENTEHLDILVNCAAITSRGEEFEPAFFERVVDVNLHGTFRTASAFHRQLKAAKGSLMNSYNDGSIEQIAHFLATL